MVRRIANIIMLAREIDVLIEQSQKDTLEDLYDRSIGNYSVKYLFNHLI